MTETSDRFTTAEERPSDRVRDDLPEVDLSEQTTSKPTMEDVTEAMKDVIDPELGVNVVDLGLVYGVTINDDSSTTLDMTLTSAACPLQDLIEDQTHSALDGLVTDVSINWVWMPPWGLERITEDGREQLRALGFNV